MKDHPLTELITKNILEDILHVGREHTIAIIRQKYWIPNCRGIIMRILGSFAKSKKREFCQKVPL